MTIQSPLSQKSRSYSRIPEENVKSYKSEICKYLVIHPLYVGQQEWGVLR